MALHEFAMKSSSSYLTIAVVLIQIVWDNRFDCCVPGQVCFISLDGTDFRILEPSPFDPKWYSHKFKGAGVRYEVGICLKTGWIV